MVDQDLLEEVQYTVIEPPDGGQSWPSELWTRDEIIGYCNERQDRFVRDTHIIITASPVGVTSAYGIRHSLPDDWMATVRVTWESPTAPRRALARSSSWEADHGIPTWPTTVGTPKLYMDGDTPPLTIQIAPLPSTDGDITVHYVPSCNPVDANGTEFDIADEFTPTIKYGILSDMFSKVGRAQDRSRAEYCEKRFQMGIEIAQTLLKGFRNA